ncbi:hypothetical protein [Sphingomonas sp. Leaf10]|uniref:hypothetical protein n=1 Tax=Sphingomonas sp. Leaf10 TaxID=1735676 RepID=UPI0007020BB8|nr:hypothetical protein [Sphingomonas sp. Leaf10]KQM37632.1 hypothetical protein ASE59_14210 [Sphingomonas sp. Leaf10]
MIDEAPGMVADPARIDAWIEVARPGDRFVYASRQFLPAGCRAGKHMRQLADRGLVTLSQKRSALDASFFNYTAHRTAAPTALTRPVRATLALAPVDLTLDEAATTDALLPVLTRFAHHGRPCPTDRQLAVRSGLTVEQVRDALVSMTAAHLIRVQKVAAPTQRRIIIVATGHITGIAA